MIRHALVLNGEILEFRDYAPNVDQSTLAEGKPRQLPVELAPLTIDPVTHVVTGSTFTFEVDRVIETPTARPKNADEIAAMIAAKDAQLEAEFERRHSAPVTFSVGGVSYQWHADAKAVENVMGVAILAVAGLTPNPREWTPINATEPVQNVNVLHLGGTIAGRRDALFAVKKAKQAAVAALTDPAAIDAYDITAGWEL